MKIFGEARKAPSIFCVILSEPIEASRRISPKARSRRRKERKAAAQDSTIASLGTASQFDFAGAPLRMTPLVSGGISTISVKQRTAPTQHFPSIALNTLPPTPLEGFCGRGKGRGLLSKAPSPQSSPPNKKPPERGAFCLHFTAYWSLQSHRRDGSRWGLRRRA